MFSSAQSDKIRADFPMLSEYTFFNSAGMTPLPVPTRDAITAHVSDLTARSYLGMPEWKITIDDARKLAAQITGAAVEEIAFIRNTSDGVSLVASGYRWKPGDEVIINDLEFPSNVYPWLNLQQRGVVVKTVKSENGRVTVDAIAREVTDKTRIVAISTVQFSTGYRADLAAIGQLAKDKGFLFFVDAIQSLGLIPMDVKAYGIDFLSCGGHKWLCATEGIGIFYCDKNRLDTLDVTRAGWHTVVNCYDFSTIDFRIKNNAERFEEGTPNLAGIYGLRESLKLVMAHGVERNMEQAFALNERLCDGLRSKGMTIVSPRDTAAESSGIVIFTTGDKDKNSALMERFRAEKVLLIDRGAGIRAATHFFNNIDDVEKMLAAAGG